MTDYKLKGNLNMRTEPDPEVEKRPQHVPRTLMVTGASRGIGLGLVRHFLEYESIEVLIATCRNPEKADELNELAKDTRLHVLALNVDDDASIRRVFGEVAELVGPQGLNLLINNAGILLPYEVDGEICRTTMLKQLETNSVSVAIVTQVFLPLLKTAAASVTGEDVNVSRAAIINISSTMASIAKNDGCFMGPMVSFSFSIPRFPASRQRTEWASRPWTRSPVSVSWSSPSTTSSSPPSVPDGFELIWEVITLIWTWMSRPAPWQLTFSDWTLATTVFTSTGSCIRFPIEKLFCVSIPTSYRYHYQTVFIAKIRQVVNWICKILPSHHFENKISNYSR